MGAKSEIRTFGSQFYEGKLYPVYDAADERKIRAFVSHGFELQSVEGDKFEAYGITCINDSVTYINDNITYKNNSITCISDSITYANNNVTYINNSITYINKSIYCLY